MERLIVVDDLYLLADNEGSILKELPKPRRALYKTVAKNGTGLYEISGEDFHKVDATWFISIVPNNRSFSKNADTFCDALGFAPNNHMDELRDQYDGMKRIYVRVTEDELGDLNLAKIATLGKPMITDQIEADWLNAGEVLEKSGDMGLSSELLPIVWNDYLLSHELQMVLLQAHSTFSGTPIQSFVLLGESGWGKTAFTLDVVPSYFRHHYGEDSFDFVFIDPTAYEDVQTMFATKEIVAEDGVIQTKFEESELAQQLQQDTDKPLVVVINEFTRTDSSYINAIMPLTGEEKTLGYGNKTVFVERPLLFFFTGNSGSGFIGTDGIDKAMKTRAGFVNLTAPTEDMWIRFGRKIIDETILSFDNVNDINDRKPDILDKVDKQATRVIKAFYKMSEYARKNDISTDISFRQLGKVITSIIKGTMLIEANLNDNKVTSIINQYSINLVDEMQAEDIQQLSTIIDKIYGTS